MLNVNINRIISSIDGDNDNDIHDGGKYNTTKGEPRTLFEQPQQKKKYARTLDSDLNALNMGVGVDEFIIHGEDDSSEADAAEGAVTLQHHKIPEPK
jgi:hypothetical protein